MTCDDTYLGLLLEVVKLESKKHLSDKINNHSHSRSIMATNQRPPNVGSACNATGSMGYVRNAPNVPSSDVAKSYSYCTLFNVAETALRLFTSHNPLDPPAPSETSKNYVLFHPDLRHILRPKTVFKMTSEIDVSGGPKDLYFSLHRNSLNELTTVPNVGDELMIMIHVINTDLGTPTLLTVHLHYDTNDFYMVGCGDNLITTEFTREYYIRRFHFNGSIFVNTDDNC